MSVIQSKKGDCVTSIYVYSWDQQKARGQSPTVYSIIILPNILRVGLHIWGLILMARS